MVLPERSPEQRAAALTKATATRRARANLRARVERGATFAEVLRDAEADPRTANMRVSELLGALPTLGKTKARQIMTEIGIAPTRRIRSLTQLQRAALLQQFGPAGTSPHAQRSTGCS